MKRLILLSFIVFITIIPATNALADGSGPDVNTVSPLTATYEIPEVFSVTATDTDGVASCTLVISSTYETSMVYNADLELWEATYTFTTERSVNSIRAKCTDDLGNETMGLSKIISVEEAPVSTSDGDSEVTPAENEVDATNWTPEEVTAVSPVLIKTPCPGGEDFTHTCRTVYFLDDTGSRHAFTNERVYFTWYEDYSNLHLVTPEVMSDFPLGANVTYRPGTQLVKFPTVRTVYAVERYSVLRGLASEDVARDLYGDDWNQQVDDIADVFLGNYSFGTDITQASHYDQQAQFASVDSINDNL